MRYFEYLSSLGTSADMRHRRSALNALCVESPPIPPGVYGKGLLTVVDAIDSSRLLAEWSWLLPETPSAIATTGFGDVFLVDRDKKVYFLEVQIAHIEFIDSDVNWVLDEFVAKPSVEDNVLRASRLRSEVSAQRELGYGECFILRPWELLGGDRKNCPYDIGKVGVYLDLVGETLRQVLAR